MNLDSLFLLYFLLYLSSFFPMSITIYSGLFCIVIKITSIFVIHHDSSPLSFETHLILKVFLCVDFVFSQL